MKQDLVDKMLYLEFKNGNKKSFEELMEKYRKNIIYFISKYTKNLDDAEDIYQEIIIYIMENREKYKNEHSFKTYLYLLAKSRAINFINSKKTFDNIDQLSEKIMQEGLLEEIVIDNEKRKKIVAAINSLKNEYALVIYLTKIEDFSYSEVAKIMNKSVIQVRNLLFYAKKKLKQILSEEGVEQSNVNTIVKRFIIILIILLNICGITYAAVKIYNKYFNATLNSSYTKQIGNLKSNNVWISNFEIAWKRLANVIGNGSIEFEDGECEIERELNKSSFSSEMLSDSCYYIEVGKCNNELKQKISNNLKSKFNITDASLTSIDFEEKENSYVIYSTLYKEMEFLYQFDRLESSTFSDFCEKVKYFGIIKNSKLKAKENVEILFYNSENDFAIRLKTKENDEIIFYKTNSSDSFSNIYNQIIEKSKVYTENKELVKGDELKIPLININTSINYEQLCGRYIKNTQKVYISSAIQKVKFTLNEKGVNLNSISKIKSDSFVDIENTRKMYFNDCFVLFIKENNQELPYFALKVDNIDILELDN